jgi:hypothetical protein
VKPTILIILVLVALAPAVAGVAAPTVVGSWDCVATDQNGSRTFWTLDVKQDGEKISLTLQSKDGDVVITPLRPEFTGSSFRFQVQINPTEVVDVMLRLDGDRLEGRFSGKDSGNGAFVATRKASAGISGEWSGEWEVSPDGGPGPHYMVLKQNGETVTGTAGPSPEQQLPIRNGKLVGDALTFDIGIPNGPSIRFEFKVLGAAMQGEAVLTMNGVERKFKLTAKRGAR